MKNKKKPYPVEDINTAIARLQGLKAHFEQHHLNDLLQMIRRVLSSSLSY